MGENEVGVVVGGMDEGGGPEEAVGEEVVGLVDCLRDGGTEGGQAVLARMCQFGH